LIQAFFVNCMRQNATHRAPEPAGFASTASSANMLHGLHGQLAGAQVGGKTDSVVSLSFIFIGARQVRHFVNRPCVFVF
jgi:hypothetical protein